MYVCICNTLTSRQVRGAIGNGATSVDAVYRDCGVAPRCGKCRPTIHSLLTGETAADRRPVEAWPAAAALSAG